jgi:hypothetical protein
VAIAASSFCTGLPRPGANDLPEQYRTPSLRPPILSGVPYSEGYGARNKSPCSQAPDGRPPPGRGCRKGWPSLPQPAPNCPYRSALDRTSQTLSPHGTRGFLLYPDDFTTLEVGQGCVYLSFLAGSRASEVDATYAAAPVPLPGRVTIPAAGRCFMVIPNEQPLWQWPGGRPAGRGRRSPLGRDILMHKRRFPQRCLEMPVAIPVEMCYNRDGDYRPPPRPAFLTVWSSPRIGVAASAPKAPPD